MDEFEDLISYLRQRVRDIEALGDDATIEQGRLAAALSMQLANRALVERLGNGGLLREVDIDTQLMKNAHEVIENVGAIQAYAYATSTVRRMVSILVDYESGAATGEQVEAAIASTRAALSAIIEVVDSTSLSGVLFRIRKHIAGKQ